MLKFNSRYHQNVKCIISFSSGVVGRHTGMKTAMKEEADPHRDPRKKGEMQCQAGPRGEAPGWSGGEGKMLYCAIFLKEQARQGKQA